MTFVNVLLFRSLSPITWGCWTTYRDARRDRRDLHLPSLSMSPSADTDPKPTTTMVLGDAGVLHLPRNPSSAPHKLGGQPGYSLSEIEEFFSLKLFEYPDISSKTARY